MSFLALLLIIFATMLYVLVSAHYLTGSDDTPVWTWPALAAPVIFALIVVLFVIYNIFLLFRTILGV